MNWTPQKLAEIPEVYRDFLLYLRPVITTRDKVLRFLGFQFGEIVGALMDEYDYEFPEFRVVADNLKEAGLVEEDDHGFFSPTAEGEALIMALSEARATRRRVVPPLPKL